MSRFEYLELAFLLLAGICSGTNADSGDHAMIDNDPMPTPQIGRFRAETLDQALSIYIEDLASQLREGTASSILASRRKTAIELRQLLRNNQIKISLDKDLAL